MAKESYDGKHRRTDGARRKSNEPAKPVILDPVTKQPIKELLPPEER